MYTNLVKISLNSVSISEWRICKNYFSGCSLFGMGRCSIHVFENFWLYFGVIHWRMLDHESTQVLFFRSSRLQELIIFIQYKRRPNKFVKKIMKKNTKRKITESSKIIQNWRLVTNNSVVWYCIILDHLGFAGFRNSRKIKWTNPQRHRKILFLWLHLRESNIRCSGQVHQNMQNRLCYKIF